MTQSATEALFADDLCNLHSLCILGITQGIEYTTIPAQKTTVAQVGVDVCHEAAGIADVQPFANHQWERLAAAATAIADKVSAMS